MSSSKEYLEYPGAADGAESLLLHNWDESRGFSEPSGNEHYNGQYPWDSWKHIMIYALAGGHTYIEKAKTEFQTLLSHQQDNGIIFNELGVKRRFDLNSLVGECNHGQPPMGGLAGLALYDSLLNRYPDDPSRSKVEADSFFLGKDRKNFLGIAKEALYYAAQRRNGDNDNLVYCVDPGETGRDEAPDFDPLYEDLEFIIRRQIPRSHGKNSAFVNRHNTFVTQYNRLHLRRMRAKAGSIEAQKEVLFFNDIEFNCLVVADCYAMARLAEKLGQDSEAEIFSTLGGDLESQILKEHNPEDEAKGMWFPEDGMFYSLKSNGEPLDRTATYANLFPLLLPNIRADQIRGILKRVPPDFMARHGLTSVAQTSPECDAEYEESESKWHGPGWGDQDELLSEAARMLLNRPDLKHEVDIIAGLKGLLGHVSSTAPELLNIWAEAGAPKPEFWNPHTSEGLRLRRVQEFGWTNMLHLIIDDLRPSVFTDALLSQFEKEKKKLSGLGRVALGDSL